MGLNPDVELAIKTITGKQRGYTELFDYYDGDQAVSYSAEALRELFRQLDANITNNVCSVVIDATKERIALKGFDAKDKTLNEALNKLVVQQDLLNEADEVHEATLVTGEGYIIEWPQVINGEGSNIPEIFYNDPRNVHIFYQGANPKVKRFAAKLWKETDGYFHLTLYYTDRLEYYVTQKKVDSETITIEAKSFEIDTGRQGVLVKGEKIIWPENPYKRIPVFHFRVEKRRIKSDIKSVIPLQKSINKLLADMMIAAEYGAFKQRYIISNANTAALKNKPNSIWDIPAGMPGEQETKVGEFQATELKNYLDAIRDIVQYIGTNTNTPRHYFDPSSDAPSGEALIAMEAPLNKKVKDRIDKFTPVWKEIAAFALEIMGMGPLPQSLPISKSGNGEGVTDITVTWEAPETVQPKTEWEIIEIQARLVPLEIVLKWHGYDQKQIDDIMTAVKKAKDEEKVRMADVYAEAAKSFGNNKEPLPQSLPISKGGNGEGNNNGVSTPAPKSAAGQAGSATEVNK